MTKMKLNKNHTFEQKRQPIYTKYAIGKPKRLIPLFLLILALISVAFAVTTTVDTFYGQTDPFEVNVEPNQNTTVYLRVPMYAYFNNATVKFEGIRQE